MNLIYLKFAKFKDLFQNQKIDFFWKYWVEKFDDFF